LKHLRIEQYQISHLKLWNDFVAKAKNSTFLFDRNFMEYHKDRFDDYSLVVFQENQVVALLPAHRVENSLYSHNGLTYGGLIINQMRLPDFLSIFSLILEYLNSREIQFLEIKTIPSIYHRMPSDEILYALFLADSQLTRRESFSVLELQRPYNITKTRMESIRRGQKQGLRIVEDANFEDFWNQILVPNLARKHHAKPVHTLEEIRLLYERFPKNIRQFNVYDADRIVAGTTVFVSDRVAHPQYVSGQHEKNELGSLDYLYYHLITQVFGKMEIFDFGTSNKQAGRQLNTGLVFWKESFGAQTITQDFYRVATANHMKVTAAL
jgi:hypothetical protein